MALEGTLLFVLYLYSTVLGCCIYDFVSVCFNTFDSFLQFFTEYIHKTVKNCKKYTKYCKHCKKYDFMLRSPGPRPLKSSFLQLLQFFEHCFTAFYSFVKVCWPFGRHADEVNPFWHFGRSTLQKSTTSSMI